MMKNNKWKLVLSSIVILLPILMGVLLWNNLPEHMATHWGVDGVADGWSGRGFAVVGLPLIMLAFHWFCILFTVKDPKNKDQNQKVIGMVLWICPVLSLVSSGMTYAAAYGMELGAEHGMLLLVGLMFALIGNYLPKCKQNFTIGIKIKWTLSNEENWNATHRFSGKAWVIGGLLLIACEFLPKECIPWAMVVVFPVLVLLPVVYSWAYYKKQADHGNVPKKATYSMARWNKIGIAAAAVISAAILVMVLFFVLGAGFEIIWGENGFTVDASGWNDLTVEYASIETVEYRDSCSVGARTNGFGPTPVQMGAFRNEEFGGYTRYPHADCAAAVIIHAEGKVLVVNGENEESTQALYRELAARQE
mgnify:CR=1 FL=1